jgi:hypothetical protein
MTQFINQETSNNVIEYLEVSAGRGKTYSTIKWIVEEQIPRGEKWVYIAPSKELINETASLVFSRGYEDFVVITDDYYKQGVMKNTLEILSEEGSSLYLITHANLDNILLSDNSFVFEGFNILIDELPNVFNMHDYTLNTKIDFLKGRLVEKEGFDGVYGLKQSKGMLEALVEDSKKNSSPKITGFAKALLRSDVVVSRKNKDSTVYQTYVVTDYQDFVGGAKRVVVLGAKVVGTLFSDLLERQGVLFKPFEDVVIQRPPYINQERVRIYYLTDENVKNGCTSSVLNSAYNIKTGKKLSYSEYRHLPNGVEDLGDGWINVYQEYVDRACNLLGKDFVYTVNYKRFTKEYKDVKYGGEDYGYCVPYGCHGLNKYSHLTKALSLFCYKPSPLHTVLLSHLAVIWDYVNIKDRYVDLKMNEASLQLCTRTKLRDYSDTDSNITFVVPDINVATYIRDFHIPDCVIDNSIALYIPDNRQSNGGHNKSSLIEDLNLPEKDRKKFNNWKSYFRKTKEREPTEEECLVKLNKLIERENNVE